MLSVRVIACLDVLDGNVVKGTGFEQLREMGDPVELAARYENEGIDELVFLDIGATPERRATVFELVTRSAERVFVPLAVGGGISDIAGVRQALLAGADKVCLNSGAVRRPELLTEAANLAGSQSIVCSIDAKWQPGGERVMIAGGRTPTDLDPVSWAREAAERGAGEILLTSVDRDGTREGYQLDLTARVAEAVPVPVIASGGAGRPAHLVDAVINGKADAVLVAGMLHDGSYSVARLKNELALADLPVREGETR